MCEDQIYEFSVDIKKLVGELRRFLELFEKYWTIYEMVHFP